MPSVFTIQGPELFPRARKHTTGRFGQAKKPKGDIYCVWMKKTSDGVWTTKRCKRDTDGNAKTELQTYAKMLKKRGVARATRVLPKGKKPRSRTRR